MQDRRHLHRASEGHRFWADGRMSTSSPSSSAPAGLIPSLRNLGTPWGHGYESPSRYKVIRCPSWSTLSPWALTPLAQRHTRDACARGLGRANVFIRCPSVAHSRSLPPTIGFVDARHLGVDGHDMMSEGLEVHDFQVPTEPASAFIGRPPYLGRSSCKRICIMGRSVSPGLLESGLPVFLCAVACHNCYLKCNGNELWVQPKKPTRCSGTQDEWEVPTHCLFMVCTRHDDLQEKGMGWGSTILCSCVVTPSDPARIPTRQPVHT